MENNELGGGGVKIGSYTHSEADGPGLVAILQTTKGSCDDLCDSLETPGRECCGDLVER